MLDFSDQPYRYFPPKFSRFWSRLLLYHNRTRHLPDAQRIMGVKTTGYDALQPSLRPGDRLVFLPNHSTHADAAIFLEALRQVGQRCLMMAAYDVFLRSRLTRFTMQRMGAFAVDRDGSDPKPMKEALATLERGKHSLAIFPEGNVYLTNDRVTPFMDGAAFIALKAQQSLLNGSKPSRDSEAGAGRREAASRAQEETSGGGGGRVLMVPVSIKATHLTNARMKIAQRFAPLAAQLGVSADFHADPVTALHEAGAIALGRNLKQRGLDVPEGDSLAALTQQAATQVLERLEAKLELTPKANQTSLERVRVARRVIHDVRTDPQRAVDHAAAATWADEAMLAFRIASYPIGYAAENPTVDRVGETVEKLEEDLFTHMPRPFANRCATVKFSAPIDVREALARGGKFRATLNQLTADTEAAVQAGLDELNSQNAHPGGQVW